MPRRVSPQPQVNPPHLRQFHFLYDSGELKTLVPWRRPAVATEQLLGLWQEQSGQRLQEGCCLLGQSGAPQENSRCLLCWAERKGQRFGEGNLEISKFSYFRRQVVNSQILRRVSVIIDLIVLQTLKTEKNPHLAKLGVVVSTVVAVVVELIGEKLAELVVAVAAELFAVVAAVEFAVAEQ